MMIYTGNKVLHKYLKACINVTIIAPRAKNVISKQTKEPFQHNNYHITQAIDSLKIILVLFQTFW